MWAVLPAKDFVDAKQRLAPVLTAAQRNALFRAMLEDVLTMLTAVRHAGAA
jgi:2-phospho-L-lactate guanylyltransferase (CobY/MobA/RfbA family)